MNLFFKRVLLFSSPFILWVVLLEIFALNFPNSFKVKSNYLKNNLDNIEILILGSSHNQNAINPELIEMMSANIAFGSQDVQLDSALFFKYMDKMPQLKGVILELDYHTMEQKNDDDYFRLPWYYKYHDLELITLPFLKKVSLYYSGPMFFNKNFLNRMNQTRENFIINKYGFIENQMRGFFYDVNYDTVKIFETIKLRTWWDNPSKENYVFNRNKINSIINRCKINQIQVLIISTPAYKSYVLTHVDEKEMRRKIYIDSLIKLSDIEYLNFESDPMFKVNDFLDDDHLNCDGAKKFSHLINNYIMEHKMNLRGYKFEDGTK